MPLQEPAYPLISSTEASKRFDLTNDYIGSLCRRGKVKGTLLGRLWYVDEGSLSQYLRQMAEERLQRRKVLSRQMRHAWAMSVLALCIFVPLRADASMVGYLETGMRQMGNTVPQVVLYEASPVEMPETVTVVAMPDMSAVAHTLAALPDAMIDTTSGWLLDAGDSLAESYIATGEYLASAASANSAAAVQAAPAVPSVAFLTLKEIPEATLDTVTTWVVTTGASNAEAYLATTEYLSEKFAYFEPQPAAAAYAQDEVPPAEFFTLVELPSAMGDTYIGILTATGEYIADVYISASDNINSRVSNDGT